MSQFRITSRYAKALLDLSIEKGLVETVYVDVQNIVKTCDNSRELVVIFKNPIILPQKKLGILEALFKNKINALTYKYIEVIVRKNRSHFLFEIMQMFEKQYKTYKNISEAILYTAQPVEESVKGQVVSLLHNSTGEIIELKTKEKPQMIGGFMIQYKDKLIDASVASKLKELRKKLTE